MSAASTCAPPGPRPSPTVQPESRKTSKYSIYGNTTRPFGESYRQSVLLQDEEADGSSVETDSVEGRSVMGCSESKAVGKAPDQGPKPTEHEYDEIRIPSKDNDGTIIETDKKVNASETLNGTVEKDKDTIYNTEIRNINSNDGNCAVAIYSEVKKETKKINQNETQTPREQLMQQIRDRKQSDQDIKENGHCTTNGTTGEDNVKQMNGTDSPVKEKEDKIINTIVTSAPTNFIEEEYSYEPDKNETTSNLVVRSRSLVNLDMNQYNYNSTMSCTLKRPNKLKMTTKADGTIRYGLRQGSSEADLLDTEIDASPTETNDARSNYVNIIKSAFDAAIESRNRENVRRAEAFDGLKQYFHDNKQGLQELLINNNVVVIEPFRSDTSDNKGGDSGSPRTCRITGATIKSPVNDQSQMPTSNTLPRRHTKPLQTNRQGFYHPIKVNKELIDAELPDPDKVRTARELFQKVATSNSATPKQTTTTVSKHLSNTNFTKSKIIPEVKVIKAGKQVPSDKRKGMTEQNVREDVKRYPTQRRWTDSGSLSSGVSSDFSCDQDWDFYHYHESPNSTIDTLEEYNSDDDDAEYVYHYDDKEKHPVSLEVLQKIRACGTTVTYYGGKVISRSHGQLRSPMTMSIMDEIRQSSECCEGGKNLDAGPEEPYLGVKFRLVKSNSCGSRLEIAGTEEDQVTKLISPRHENFRGKTIEEEVADIKEEDFTKEVNSTATETPKEVTETVADTLIKEKEEQKEEPEDSSKEDSSSNPPVMTWAELKLKDARKQFHCAPEAVRIPSQDMEFETFEVLDESSTHPAVKTETTGRG